MDETTYILGSGRSIARLTPTEIEHLNASGRTIAMNRFLLHADAVGIRPKAAFLSDYHPEAIATFVRLIEARRAMDDPPPIHINRYFRRFLDRDLPHRLLGLFQRVRLYQRCRLWVPFGLPKQEVHYFRARAVNREGFWWADSFEEELFFYRGSLTTCLNLAWLLHRAKRICLIGVDLNESGYFWDDNSKPRPDATPQNPARRLSKTEREVAEAEAATGRHATAAVVRGLPPIQHVIPRIRDALAERGCRLVSANPTSLLVQEGALPHEPIV